MISGEVDAVFNSFENEIDLCNKSVSHGREGTEELGFFGLSKDVADHWTYAKGLGCYIEEKTADRVKGESRQSN